MSTDYNHLICKDCQASWSAPVDINLSLNEMCDLLNNRGALASIAMVNLEILPSSDLQACARFGWAECILRDLAFFHIHEDHNLVIEDEYGYQYDGQGNKVYSPPRADDIPAWITINKAAHDHTLGHKCYVRRILAPRALYDEFAAALDAIDHSHCVWGVPVAPHDHTEIQFECDPPSPWWQWWRKGRNV